MSDLLTLMDTLSAISSRGSGDGASPSGLPGGETTCPCGPEAAPVSRSARRARAAGLQTSATSGPSSTGSSESIDLQSSLGSRLRARLEGLGSPLYGLTWKDWTMESGPPICALRGSVPRTSASESGGEERTGWPTPMAGTPAQSGYNEAGNTDSGRKTVALCGAAVKGSGVTFMEDWIPARRTTPGETLTGSSAGMGGGGQLSPEHSRWLMGYPAAWASCAPTGTRSSRKSQRSSSKPSEKPHKE